MQKVPIHKKSPNQRVIRTVVEALEKGAVISYPTDTVYGLGCDFSNPRAVERLYTIKPMAKNRRLTILCTSLSEVSQYAVVSNASYRLLKRILPGPYTIILEATREVPRNLLHNKRRTIGIRIPNHEVPIAICQELGRPILSTSAIDSEGNAFRTSEGISEQYRLAFLLDAGALETDVSTIISLLEEEPKVVRQGQGSVEGIL